MLKRFQKQNWLIPFLISTFVVLFIYRGILANPSAYLPDRFDFPYYAWLLNHVLQFITGSHQSLFTTNIFFSFENSYFFSDLLIPQALLGLIPYLLGANPIFVTNFVIIGTFILNILAAIYLWKNWLKNTWALSFATLVTALSPFVLIQRGHLQMMTTWPFLLIIALLIHKQKTYKSALLIGILWIIQLLGSAYLAIFLIVCIGWMAILELIIRPNKKQVFLFYVLLGVTATALGGPILLKYKMVQQSYGVTINYGEYITYNAHLSDYLFIPYHTLGQQLSAKWQHFNKHTVGEGAMYPGIALIGLAALGLLKYKKQKNTFQLTLPLNITHLFFLGLLVIGGVFSLGPRLFVNGAYTQLPLPYIVPLKLLPFFTAIRATARWSWLVYLALGYFSVLGLSIFKSKRTTTMVSIAAICLFLIEIIPLGSSSFNLSHALNTTDVAIANCQNGDNSLLIYPITQQHLEADLYTNLARKTEHLLKSTQHSCHLVNGYGGFEPPAYKQLENDLNLAIQNNDLPTFITLAQQKGITMILLESKFLAEENKIYLDTVLHDVSLENEVNATIIEEQTDNWYLLKL